MNTPEYNHNYYFKNRKQLRIKHKIWYKRTWKQRRFKVNLKNKERIKQRYLKDKRFRLMCIEKSLKHYYSFRLNILKQRKMYYIKNHNKILERMKKYHKIHRKERNYYQYLKRINDLNYKLSCLLRNRLNRALERNTKYGKALFLLGCSVKFLKSYLERRFKTGMNWNNYGRNKNNWQIDHIKPCNQFDLRKKSEQKKCFHYTNLQPLWVHENIRKRNSDMLLTK
jgi:hypothetical protein